MKTDVRIGELKVTLTGSHHEILEALKKLGASSKMHYSETKGELVLIESMDTSYLRNAILKMTRENTNLFRGMDNLELTNHLRGLFYDTKIDVEFEALLNELEKRID